MITTATLLLRTPNTRTPLTLLVERALKKPPLKWRCQLILLDGKRLVINQLDDGLGGAIYDEGIESDMDTLSLTSVDDERQQRQRAEMDSANGSSEESGDDGDNSAITKTIFNYNLTDCVCYTDCRFDNMLILIGGAVYVFQLNNSNALRVFCTNFNALKIYVDSKRHGHRFDLIKRTDSDGITHIEVAPSVGMRRIWTSVDDLTRRRKKPPAPPPPPPLPPPPIIILPQLAPPTYEKRRFAFVWPRSRSEQRYNGEQKLLTPSGDKRLTMAHRFFGLSSKLCDFNKIQPVKSSFKKNSEQQKCEKRVTFSAYATVKVV